MVVRCFYFLVHHPIRALYILHVLTVLISHLYHSLYSASSRSLSFTPCESTWLTYLLLEGWLVCTLSLTIFFQYPTTAVAALLINAQFYF